MKKLLITIFLTSYAWANVSPLKTLKSSDGKQWTLFQLDSEVLGSPSCLKKSCLALQKIKVNNQPVSKNSWVKNPAASLCESAQGKYIRGSYENGDEDGICLFKDGSYILAWDFFEVNNPKRKEP